LAEALLLSLTPFLSVTGQWWTHHSTPSGEAMTFTTRLEQEFDWSRGSGSKHELGYKFYTLFCRKQQLALLIQDPVNLLNFPSQNVNTEQLQCAVSFILTVVSRFFRGGRRLLPPKKMMFLLIGVVQRFSRQIFG